MSPPTVFLSSTPDRWTLPNVDPLWTPGTRVILDNGLDRNLAKCQ